MVLESNFEFRSTGVTFLMVMDSDYLTKWQIINQIVVLVMLLLGHEGVHGIVLNNNNNNNGIYIALIHLCSKLFTM